MKKFTKLLTLLLVLLMLVQSTVVTAFAITPIDIDEISPTYSSGTGYTNTDDVEYKYSGSYIYNWGAREEEATFLSPNAEDFYTGSYVYDVLSTKKGGTSESTAKTSDLYYALKSLMSGRQTYQTSYDATKNLFQYTDCQLGGGKISSFYSGNLIGPSWNGGWNREHCWPNSKGDASGNGENDIMMLRPTSTSENSSRGNKAYGESSGYYNPNSESNGKYDLRGDVSRIVLYTYVRWGCTNTGSKYNPNGITGTNGVIQSIDILLKWMEEDPVDTWELGRNDSVESITGTRNVFVDYPEYAWLLFGEEIPEDMVTPSGEASEGACDHDWSVTSSTQATCTTAGATVYKCSICQKTKTESAPATGHSWNSGVITAEPTCTTVGVKTFTCSKCNGAKTQTISATGHSYGDWIIDKEATETETGSKHKVCATCNNVETVTIPLVGHEHSYTSAVTAPTCTSRGYTTHTCNCGDYYVDSYKDILDHNYSNGICSLCGAVDPSTPVPTKDDFTSILTYLMVGRYTGQEKYIKMCEAVNIYNHLSDKDKESIADKYEILKYFVLEYNAEATATNEASTAIVNYTAMVDASMVAFATYTFIKKFRF